MKKVLDDKVPIEMAKGDPVLYQMWKDLKLEGKTDKEIVEYMNSKGYNIKPIWCTECRKKNIETPLVPDENITKKRLKNSQYICNECYKERMDKYRLERWQEYKDKKITEMVESFTNMWNDTTFSKMKILADRLVRVFDKYGIRTAEKGIIRDVLCQVIFPDLWFVEADKVVNDMLASKGHMTTSTKLTHKQILLQYIPDNVKLYTEIYRNEARQKFDALVHAINTKYSSEEKLIGTPRWEDPFTHLKEPRWRLLSDRETLNIRKTTRETERDNSLRTDHKEEVVVDTVTGKLEEAEKTINEGNQERSETQ